MRLAIADPPYLGRADRWYGTGRGIKGGRGRADTHPDARLYDDPATHRRLLAQLRRDFDGWALFTGQEGLRVLLPQVAPNVILCSWTVTNAPPSGSRILTAWEPVLVSIPRGRRAHGTGPATRSSYVCSAPRQGFVGSKPAQVTRWLLDILGYDPDRDTVADLFPGSGSVSAAIEQGVLL